MKFECSAEKPKLMWEINTVHEWSKWEKDPSFKNIEVHMQKCSRCGAERMKHL